MTSAVQTELSYDLTDAPHLIRRSIALGAIQAVVVLLVSLINRFFEGTADHALTGIVVAIGTIITVFFPGLWTRARTIEGIAGAAGIGLGAALSFMLIDIAVLQPLGTWTNRWYEVGGHSNWWYHPVWWMVGCYLSWQGAFVLAHLATKRGGDDPSLPSAIGLVAALAAILGAAAAALHIPHAGWNVPTFAVAVLPALAVATVVTGLGAPRS